MLREMVAELHESGGCGPVTGVYSGPHTVVSIAFYSLSFFTKHSGPAGSQLNEQSS